MVAVLAILLLARAGLRLEVDVVGVRGPHRARAHHAREAPARCSRELQGHGRRHAADRGEVERGRARARARTSRTSTPPTRARTQSAPNGVPGLRPLRRPRPRARALGLRIIITITGDAPRWATDGGRGTGANANYGQRRRVRAVRGRGREAILGQLRGLPAVHYFTIWNEPNHRNFLKPTRERARASTATWSTRRCPQIRRNGAADAQIFVGEPAPVGRAPVAMGPKAFLRRWLCLNKRLRRTSRGTGCRSFKRSTRTASRTTPTARPSACPKKRT